MQEIHPLQRPRGYAVQTAPVKETLKALMRVLRTPEMGMVVTGPWRFGKSSFIDLLELRFADEPRIAVLRSTMSHDIARNWENRFYRRLRGEEEGADLNLVMQQPRASLLRHIQNECDRLGTRHVLFALDEAQNLTIPQLDVLKTLSENLLSMGLKPFVLLVGQPELMYLIERLKDHSRHDLLQRFMLRQHTFRGLRNAEEFATFLRHTDEVTWPPGCGRTYTEHFASVAWNRGWRVGSEYQALWSAFESLAAAIKLDTTAFEIGVTYVAQAQFDLLWRVGHSKECPVNVAGELSGRANLLRLAVENSGFSMSQQVGRKPSNDPNERLRQAKRWVPGGTASR